VGAAAAARRWRHAVTRRSEIRGQMIERGHKPGDWRCDMEMLLALCGGAFFGVIASRVFDRVVGWILSRAGL